MAASSSRSQLKAATGSSFPREQEDIFEEEELNTAALFQDGFDAWDETDDDSEQSFQVSGLRKSLRYTQEVPVLQQIFSAVALRKSGNPTHLSLSEVSETLAELLRKAIERDQPERVNVLLSFQEQLDRLPQNFAKQSRSSADASSILILPPPKASLQSFLRSSVSGSSSSSSSASSSSSSSSTATLDCPICFDSFPVETLRSFSTCGSHYYCYPCLSAHLLALITDAELHRISCPQPGCGATPLESDIQDLVSPDIFDKYLRFTVLAVLDSEHVRWCPRPECAQPCLMAETCDDRGECPHCLAMFCTKCSKVYHPDTDCEGQLIDENERLFQSWMSDRGVLVKNCPACNHSVEKNSGCNHMTCRCGAGWCWLCNETYDSSHFSSGKCQGFQFVDFNSLLDAQLNNLRNTGPAPALRAEHDRLRTVRLSEFRASLAVELRRRVDLTVKEIRPSFLHETFNQATQSATKIFDNEGFKAARRALGQEADAELAARSAEEANRLREYYEAELTRLLAESSTLEAELQLIVAENERRQRLNLPLHTREEETVRAQIEAARRQRQLEQEAAQARIREAEERQREADRLAAEEAEARAAAAREHREANRRWQIERQEQRQAAREAMRNRRPGAVPRQRAQVLFRFGGAL